MLFDSFIIFALNLLHGICPKVLSNLDRSWIAHLTARFSFVTYRDLEHLALATRHVPRVVDVILRDAR